MAILQFICHRWQFASSLENSHALQPLILQKLLRVCRFRQALDNYRGIRLRILQSLESKPHCNLQQPVLVKLKLHRNLQQPGVCMSNCAAMTWSEQSELRVSPGAYTVSVRIRRCTEIALSDTRHTSVDHTRSGLSETRNLLFHTLRAAADLGTFIHTLRVAADYEKNS